jgi:pimeloyl-ACP methyl ester carboxylesterase
MCPPDLVIVQSYYHEEAPAMADQLSTFRTPEAAARYLEVYDDLVARTWPEPRAELDVPTRFGTTRVRRTGPEDGTPLVLIHPTSGSSLGWRSLIAPLAERHAVYTPDTIGTIGRSVQTAPVRSAGDLVTWLDDVVGHLGLDPFHLGGYSEGGWIAGTYAALTGAPERLATLTLIEPAGAITQIPRHVLASLIARAARTLVARDKEQAIRRFNRWMNGDIELADDEVELVLMAFSSFRQKLPTPEQLPDDQLRRIRTPTLLLLGADSRICDPDKVAERARTLLPDVTVEITPDAGHGLALQHPDQITRRILAFVADHDPPPDTP